MKTRTVTASLALTLMAAAAQAHVSVRPRESKPGVTETYTVRVPTEGKVATTSVEVEIAAPPQAAPSAENTAITAWLQSHDRAFVAKDLDALASFYHPDVTFFEGGGINNGWADYRDHHIGPELKAFENLQFEHRNVVVHVLDGGAVAYVTSEYQLKARSGAREIDSAGLDTRVLVKSGGAWKIRHSHTSARRRPAPADR